jgi:branched-chain amino acid aminotransferase
MATNFSGHFSATPGRPADERRIAWVDGGFEARVDPFDRGLTLGDGVFDTLIAIAGEPFAGERHLRRLLEHSEAIGIRVDGLRVREGWKAVLARVDREPVVLRTTVTRGRAERGLWVPSPAHPTIIVTAAPWSAGVIGRPVRLVISSVTRNAGSPTSRLKTLNYLDNILAAREAAAKGGDDALLLNAAGRVACTTIANIFAIFGHRLVTPPLVDGVMAGIMRALVLEAGAAAGLRAEEASLTVGELQAAEAVFTSNSVRFLSPVTALDSSPLPSQDHPAIERLREIVASDVPGLLKRAGAA